MMRSQTSAEAGIKFANKKSILLTIAFRKYFGAVTCWQLQCGEICLDQFAPPNSKQHAHVMSSSF